MRNKLILCYIFLAFPAFFGCGQNTQKSPEDVIEKSVLKEQICFLASDEMMGRNTGSDEIKETAYYIAEYFREIGVKEFPGAPGYMQKVPLKISKPVKKCDLEIKDLQFMNGEQLVLRAGGKLVTTTEILYLPKKWWDEQSGDKDPEEIKDKIIFTELGADQNTGFDYLG